MSELSASEKLHKQITSVASGSALIATGAAAFTTGVPVLTGVLVGAALIGGGAAAYNYYRSLEDEQRSGNVTRRGSAQQL